MRAAPLYSLSCFICFMLFGFSPLMADESQGFFEATGKYEGNYLCTAEVSGGLTFRNNTWQGTSFIADKKYVVRIQSLNEIVGDSEWDRGMKYSVAIMQHGTGSDINQSGHICSSRVNRDLKISTSGVFTCWVSLNRWTMNLTTNRYLSAYFVGYTQADPEIRKNNTPNLEGGVCSKL